MNAQPGRCGADGGSVGARNRIGPNWDLRLLLFIVLSSGPILLSSGIIVLTANNYSTLALPKGERGETSVTSQLRLFSSIGRRCEPYMHACDQSPSLLTTYSSYLESSNMICSDGPPFGVFAPTFKWGLASSAVQVEGGATSDGKGPSVWDTKASTPGQIFDGSSPNVCNDSYHLCEEDLKLLKLLGVKAYRFSISWPRVIPKGA